MSRSVLLVDDDEDVRAVVTALLVQDGGFTVVGEAADGAAGVTLAGHLRPDVVLLDLAMPVMDGLSALPEILRVAPASDVVVLSAFGTDRTVHAALDAGAAGFVHKGADLPGRLIPVLEAVVRSDSPRARGGCRREVTTLFRRWRCTRGRRGRRAGPSSHLSAPGSAAQPAGRLRIRWLRP